VAKSARKKIVRREYTKTDQRIARALESENAGRKDCQNDQTIRRIVASESA
jgi:hypothetical protein